MKPKAVQVWRRPHEQTLLVYDEERRLYSVNPDTGARELFADGITIIAADAFAELGRYEPYPRGAWLHLA